MTEVDKLADLFDGSSKSKPVLFVTVLRSLWVLTHHETTVVEYQDKDET